MRKKSRKFQGQIVQVPTGLWTRCRVCPCCGRFVVKLRLPDGPGWVTCYFKGWDGHPWYTAPGRIGGMKFRGNAMPHPVKKKRRPREPVEGYDREEYFKNRAAEKDSFFSLESVEVPESVPSEPSIPPTQPEQPNLEDSSVASVSAGASRDSVCDG